METSKAPRIFLDLDGVLADFDHLAEKLLDTNNIYKFEFVHGPQVFWEILNREPNFFRNLPLMPDGMELWYGVKKYGMPTILTALPREDAHEVDLQKREWVSFYLGGDVPVITCQTPDKPKYCNPGDILIDDRTVNQGVWEAAGGHFIHHLNAGWSLMKLARILAGFRP